MTTPETGSGRGGPGMHSGMEFAGAGLEFAAAILIFLYAGKWVDEKLGTAPSFLIVGVFVGAAGGFWSMYRKLMKAGPRS